MSESIRATLVALEDVQGVAGSFVLDADGRLVAMAMPPLFDESTFEDVGPRIGRLSESFASLGDELDSCMVRFADHVLSIKKLAKGGALCILASQSVNLAALKMATNLADRRLSAAIRDAGPGGAASRPSAAPASRPGAPEPAPERAKAPRYYRGQLVED